MTAFWRFEVILRNENDQLRNIFDYSVPEIILADQFRFACDLAEIEQFFSVCRLYVNNNQIEQ